MVTIRLPPDFKEFLRLLNSEKVRYLLVGGFAVGYYGYPRATGDMDIWIAMSAANAQRLLKALDHFGFAQAKPTAKLFTRKDQIVRMGNPPMRIEILTTISGVDFSDCYRRRKMAVIDGVSVPIISLDDLKANKKAAGRLKDLSDLDHLP